MPSSVGPDAVVCLSLCGWPGGGGAVVRLSPCGWLAGWWRCGVFVSLWMAGGWWWGVGQSEVFNDEVVAEEHGSEEYVHLKSKVRQGEATGPVSSD